MHFEIAPEFRSWPQAREAATLIEPCIQCGHCEPTCPTFRLLNDPWDGPRGRIYLMTQLLEGEAAAQSPLPPQFYRETLQGRTAAGNLRLHLDRCLTCKSCVTSCPQGVDFGRLLDVGRELAERTAGPRPLHERWLRRGLRAVVPHRARFALLLGVARALRGLLPRGWRERVLPARPAGAWPSRVLPRRMLVWQGCVQPAIDPGINAATARVLDRMGIQLLAADSGCCGALSQHMAEPEEALSFMRRNIDALWPQVSAGAEAIVMTASGCGAHLRDYGRLLRDDAAYCDKAARIASLTRDIAEVVAAEWPAGPPLSAAAGRRVAYQSPCSLQHGQKLRGAVEQLLRRAGFKLVVVDYPFQCCGAAGGYTVLQAPLSRALRDMKLKTLLSRRAEVIATANIGCLNHLAGASPLPVRHWIELLDEAMAGTEAGRSAESLVTVQPTNPS
jgi:glycolate oxidase iron-sulfur subunit